MKNVTTRLPPCGRARRGEARRGGSEARKEDFTFDALLADLPFEGDKQIATWLGTCSFVMAPMINFVTVYYPPPSLLLDVAVCVPSLRA